MAITSDGWLDWAFRHPGPAHKVNGWNNPATMYFPHSAVGFANGVIDAVMGPLKKSVHGLIEYDGTVVQFYPLTAQCWHAGADYPNDHGIAFENEGGFVPEDEPLTDAQLAANIRIIREWSEWKGWKAHRRPVNPTDKGADLYEHRECVRWGAAPTACPSGRIPWDKILAAVNVSPPFTYTREQKLTALTSFAFRATALDPAEGLDKLHPFDAAIVKAEAAKLP